MVMNNSLARALAIGATATLLGLPLALQAQTFAVVNGKPVPKARVDALMNQVTTQGRQTRTPELERQVQDEVLLREVFVQEADRAGLRRSREYLDQLAYLQESLLIRALFDDFNKKHPVSDADIQAEYNKIKEKNGGKEYHARHILLEKEDDAKAVIAQLKAGAKFETLAAAQSKDPGSATKGGDLDWANSDSFVPEFAQALRSLAAGQTTDSPVRTQFGYHVIRLDESREPQFPPLDQVRPQIEQRLQQQRLADYREQLRAKAKVTYPTAKQ